ncbi:unnamed protein product, partial [Ixodes persulcatus]
PEAVTRKNVRTSGRHPSGFPKWGRVVHKASCGESTPLKSVRRVDEESPASRNTKEMLPIRHTPHARSPSFSVIAASWTTDSTACNVNRAPYRTYTRIIWMDRLALSIAASVLSRSKRFEIYLN